MDKKKIMNWVIAIIVAIVYLIVSIILRLGNILGLYGLFMQFIDSLYKISRSIIFNKI